MDRMVGCDDVQAECTSQWQGKNIILAVVPDFMAKEQRRRRRIHHVMVVDAATINDAWDETVVRRTSKTYRTRPWDLFSGDEPSPAGIFLRKSKVRRNRLLYSLILDTLYYHTHPNTDPLPRATLLQLSLSLLTSALSLPKKEC